VLIDCYEQALQLNCLAGMVSSAHGVRNLQSSVPAEVHKNARLSVAANNPGNVPCLDYVADAAEGVSGDDTRGNAHKQEEL
jgi:hypothetical protein